MILIIFTWLGYQKCNLNCVFLSFAVENIPLPPEQDKMWVDRAYQAYIFWFKNAHFLYLIKKHSDRKSFLSMDLMLTKVIGE